MSYTTSLIDDLVSKTAIGEHDAVVEKSSAASSAVGTLDFDVRKVFSEELPAIFATNADAAKQIGVRFQICVTF